MNNGATRSTKISDVTREWHMVDLAGKTLGRIATDIAKLLIGKSKPYFVRNLDCGDFVVAINAKDIKVTGKKDEQKIYYRYSGYPGGLRKETLAELKERIPEKVIEFAVKGMLPQNRLRDKMLGRLFVFSGSEHTYGDRFKKKNQEARVKNQEKKT